ncbi:hypothetical protein A6769_39325 [Nostoc punctiforme NIES-2108]|uniref:Uncharacterized protein n=1 Tax=Nostoc punctiforme NIES-2108 TaxID=1356359 RepID=A0A367RWH5_NOSPU|nr:hypothetical protein A6769_39325 [Nostoc punctiforme NIES-2108]
MLVLSLIALAMAVVFLCISANITDRVDQIISMLVVLFFLALSLIFAPLLIKLLIATVLLRSLQPILRTKSASTEPSISQKEK